MPWVRSARGRAIVVVDLMPGQGVCKTVAMGEPLANYKRVVNAVRRITSPAPDGLGISQRNVVVSTVGLAPAIRKLADEGRGCCTNR